jgi:serine protease inhibitor
MRSDINVARSGRISQTGSLAGAALVAQALLLAACGSGAGAPAPTAASAAGVPPAVFEAEEQATPVNAALVNADTGLGLALLAQLAQGNSTNVAISPLSLAMALQILYNGSAGSTQQAMAQVLELGALSDARALDDANAALQASLIGADPKLQLIVANSLWMHSSDNPVLPSFTGMDENYYGATIGDLAGAPADVNAWVASETRGLIPTILPKSGVNYADVIAVIANAVYFKGEWTTAFNPADTAAVPFFLADGTQTTVEMMSQSGTYPFLAGANFAAARLPYGQGRFSMLLVLPDPGIALGDFVAGLTVEELNGWTGQWQMEAGIIFLPRFTATFGPQSLNAQLISLGMGIIYCSSNHADFAALASRPSCISDVRHATVVEVDESGTVAAAATTVTVMPTVVGPGSPFVLRLDRPFLYAIQDNRSGELLFIGVMMDPS